MFVLTHLRDLILERAGSAARLAHEYHEAKIAFSLIRSDLPSVRENLKRRRSQSRDHKHPVILLKEVHLPWMTFLTEEQKRAFSRGDIVDAPVGPGRAYQRLDYVNGWAWRFKISRVGVILPERASDFFGPQDPKEKALFAAAQELVKDRKLDPDLHDAFVVCENKDQVILVLDIGLFNLLPALMRVVRIDATKMIFYV